MKLRKHQRFNVQSHSLALKLTSHSSWVCCHLTRRICNLLRMKMNYSSGQIKEEGWLWMRTLMLRWWRLAEWMNDGCTWFLCVIQIPYLICVPKRDKFALSVVRSSGLFFSNRSLIRHFTNVRTLHRGFGSFLLRKVYVLKENDRLWQRGASSSTLSWKWRTRTCYSVEACSISFCWGHLRCSRYDYPSGLGLTMDRKRRHNCSCKDEKCRYWSNRLCNACPIRTRE
jgi:hypothetical protein